MAFVAETLDVSVSEVGVDSDLHRTGRLDSLAIVSLVTFLDDEFAVKLPVAQLVPANFSSVRQIIKLVDTARGDVP